MLPHFQALPCAKGKTLVGYCRVAAMFLACEYRRLFSAGAQAPGEKKKSVCDLNRIFPSNDRQLIYGDSHLIRFKIDAYSIFLLEFGLDSINFAQCFGSVNFGKFFYFLCRGVLKQENPLKNEKFLFEPIDFPFQLLGQK